MDPGSSRLLVSPVRLSSVGDQPVLTSQNLALQKVVPGHHYLHLLFLFNIEVVLLLRQL